MHRLRPAVALAGIMILLGTMGCAQAQQPAAEITPKQKRLFAQCRACHSITADGPQIAGPSLHGVVGSRAGTRGGYRFSEAMKNSGVIWTEEALEEFLKSPQAMIPKNAMAFAGVAKEDDRKALIAYLKTLK